MFWLSHYAMSFYFALLLEYPTVYTEVMVLNLNYFSITDHTQACHYDNLSCNQLVQISYHDYHSIPFKVTLLRNKSLCLSISLMSSHRNNRNHSVYVPSQWETVLHCNTVSHWLGAYTELIPEINASNACLASRWRLKTSTGHFEGSINSQSMCLATWWRPRTYAGYFQGF